MKVGAVVAMVVVGVVLFFLAFTAEGAPSGPTLQSATTLNPTAGAQVFSWTATAQVNGIQPINSIDEQGAWYTYSVWQNGHPVTLNQRVSMGVASQSGFTFTLQTTPSVGLPSVCTGSGCGGIVENVTVLSWVTIPSWLGVFTGPATNVTFSTVTGFSTHQATQTVPMGAFLFNSLGIILLLIAVESTIFLAFFVKGAHTVAIAAGSWGFFVIVTIAAWMLH